MAESFLSSTASGSACGGHSVGIADGSGALPGAFNVGGDRQWVAAAKPLIDALVDFYSDPLAARRREEAKALRRAAEASLPA